MFISAQAVADTSGQGDNDARPLALARRLATLPLLMPPKFRYHVFVCQNRRDPGDPRGDCASKGSEGILETFKEGIKERKLSGIARANKAGCLDACKWGPSVVVYPEGVWYTVKSADDAREIIDEHLVNGRVVERLLMK